jgi:hypothetical protein
MACQALGGQTGKNVKRRSHQGRGLAHRYYRITALQEGQFRGLRVSRQLDAKQSNTSYGPRWKTAR